MDPALRKLLRLRLRGALRRSLRGIKTVRGKVFFLLGLGALLFFVVPNLLLLFHEQPRPTAEMLRDAREVLPLGLLAVVLLSLFTTARQEGIPFSPAEIDFLFSGPFPRRQLVLYRLSSGMASSLFAALFISLPLRQHAQFWLAAFLGTSLALVFVNLIATALVLLAQTVTYKAYSGARKAVLLAVLATVVLLAAQWFPTLRDQGFVQAARSLCHAAPVCWLLLPLEPFGRAVTAERLLPDLLGWAAAAAAIDLALLWLLLRIDVNFLEASLVAGQKRYQMLERRRRSGGLAIKPHAAWRIPPLPWLGGAGPIAWRQLVTALRGVHGLLFFLLLVLGFGTLPLLLQTQKSAGGVGFIIGQVGFLTLVMSRAMSFDFRGDLDWMDSAKSLPLRPVAITLGQLATPVLLMTTAHAIVFAVVASLLPDARATALTAALFSLPFNFLLFGIDNLFFLLFPVRVVATTPGDLQHMGRAMVEMLTKTFAVGLGCAAAALIGLAGYWLTGESLIVAEVVAWLALLLCGCSLVPAIAAAFRRFDVSTDTPA